mgnify:CR=1 FL=1
MRRILSKSLLIAIILYVLISAGCVKRAIPDMVAEAERALFAFQEYEITYDELKERIGGYYIDFDHTVGEEAFAGYEGKTYLNKDMEGMSLEEINALVAPIYENFEELGIKFTVASAQVSISEPEDAMADWQLVYTWREDVIEEFNNGPVTRIVSTRYFLSKTDGKWRIDWVDARGCVLSGDEERDELLLEDISFIENEGEYRETITLK